MFGRIPKSRTRSLPFLGEQQFEALMRSKGASTDEDNYKWTQNLWWYIWLSEALEESNKGMCNATIFMSWDFFQHVSNKFLW